MTLQQSLQFARNGNTSMAAVAAVPDAVFARIYSASTDYHLARDGGLWTLTTADGEHWTLPRARDALRITHIGDDPRGRVVEKYLGATPLTADEIDTVVDIGAFVGEFGRRLDASVLAVEPDPLNARCLRRNLSDDATIVEVAAWHSDTRLHFHSADDGSDSSIGPLDPGARERRGVLVDARPLRTLCEKYGVVPDLIKIDAEGAEPEVLAGAIGLNTPIVVDVAAERGGSSPLSAVTALLRSHGYAIQFDRGHSVVFADPGGA